MEIIRLSEGNGENQNKELLDDLVALYNELHAEMLKDFNKMKKTPPIPSGQMLIDKNIYGGGFMYSGRVGAMEDALDGILKLINKYKEK